MRPGRLLLTAGMLLSASLQCFAGSGQNQADQEATDALYNLDFDTVEQNFERLTRMDPSNPANWNGLASVLWLRMLYEQQKLNIESFSSASSFGTRESRDIVKAAHEQRLRATVDRSIAQSQAILKKRPQDVQALYTLGAANAILASFEATAKRSYRNAYRAASEARDRHAQVLKLDPSFDDARVSVGLYDYVMGVIPGYIRFFLAMFGVRGGDRQRGIEQLEYASRHAKLAATDAKVLLVVIYNREKQYDKSLRALEELHRRYPRNFLFETAQASVYGRVKKWDQALATYQRILSKIDKRQDGYEKLGRDKVVYAMGKVHIERLDFDAAMAAFTEVIQSPAASDNEKAGAHLWMGKIFDSHNDRNKALQQYEALMALNCDSGLKEEASRYRRKPFK